MKFDLLKLSVSKSSFLLAVICFYNKPGLRPWILFSIDFKKRDIEFGEKKTFTISCGCKRKVFIFNSNDIAIGDAADVSATTVIGAAAEGSARKENSTPARADMRAGDK